MVILLWSINLFTQAPDTLWTRTYGGVGNDVGYSVQQTSDGGYIIAGITTSFGADNYDVYLVKTDSKGDTIWTKIYGGAEYDFVRSVYQTTDRGYIMGGYTGVGYLGGDVYLIRTDSLGNVVWTKTYIKYGADEIWEVQQTTDGGFVFGGYTHSSGGNYDVYLIKTDANGDTLWTKTYGGLGTDYGYSVQQTSDEGYIIAGYTTSFGAGESDYYLIKTDKYGDTLWTKTFGCIYEDDAYSVRQTSDKGYIIVGISHPTGLEAGDVYLVKTDANGDTIWTRIYDQLTYDFAYDVQQTSDNGYIIVNFKSYEDVQLIKTDESGDTLWTKICGGAGTDCGYSVQQTTDGGYIIAGTTVSFGAGNGDVYLIKVLPEGAIPQAWIIPSSFSVAVHQEGSRIEPLVIGNSGNGFLTWNISENPPVDWLSEDTTSGSVYPEDSMSVSLTFDATDLSQGAYYDTLVISTNDTNNPTFNIPIELRVIMSDMIFVFPSPFMPKKGHTILTFANLPDEGTIKIYTIAGNLVWDHQFVHPEIFYSWDVRNNDDKDIASGIYIYLVEDKSGDAVKKGKFAIVR